MYDKSVSLCFRFRHARLKASASKWWAKQLGNAPSCEDLEYTLLVLISWSGRTVLEKLLPIIDQKLNDLSYESYSRICKAAVIPFMHGNNRNRRVLDSIAAFPDEISERTLVALSSRQTSQVSIGLFHKFLEKYSGDDVLVYEYCQKVSLQAAQRNSSAWKDWLPVISRSYSQGVIADEYFGYKFARYFHMQSLPQEDAEEIIENGDSYPVELVGTAEETCRRLVIDSVTPVGEVAEEKEWFVEEDE